MMSNNQNVHNKWIKFKLKKKNERKYVRAVLHSTKLSALNTEIIIITVYSPSIFTLCVFFFWFWFLFSLFVSVCLFLPLLLVLQSIVIVIVVVVQHGSVWLFVCSHIRFRHFFTLFAIVVAVAVRCCMDMWACKHAMLFFVRCRVAFFLVQFYL